MKLKMLFFALPLLFVSSAFAELPGGIEKDISTPSSSSSVFDTLDIPAVGKVQFSGVAGVMTLTVDMEASATWNTDNISGVAGGAKDGRMMPHSHGSFVTRFGADWGDLSANVKLNMQRQVTEELYNQFEQQGEALTSGLDASPSATLLEEATVTWAVFTCPHSGHNYLAFTVGRDSVTPLGSYAVPMKTGLSVLESDKISQTEMIRLEVHLPTHTDVELVSYGHDWFGYPGENSRFNSVDQDGDGSFALNATQQLGVILGGRVEGYGSFARTEAGFTNLGQPLANQRGEQDTVSVGAKYQAGAVTLSAEQAMQDNKNGLDNETALMVNGALQLSDVHTLFGTYEDQSSVLAGEDGNIYTVGLGWKLTDALSLTLEAKQIDPNGSSPYEAGAFGLVWVPFKSSK